MATTAHDSAVRSERQRGLGDPVTAFVAHAFSLIGGGSALLLALLVGSICASVVALSAPSLERFGIGFLTARSWDPVHGAFGALPFVFGTLVTSAAALLLALPVSLSVALFLTDLGPESLRKPISAAVQMLAAIPSVVYGLWGALALAPFLRTSVEPMLEARIGTPLFSGPKVGIGFLCASLVLALMIVPTITAISREVFRAVPAELREGGLALGATRWDVVRLIVLPHARRGMLGAVMLGFGRAAGETMAVAMVVGSRPEIRASLFSPGYTMASVIGNEFADATTDLHIGALSEIGLVLFLFTLLVNVSARVLVARVGRRMSPGGPLLVREGGS